MEDLKKHYEHNKSDLLIELGDTKLKPNSLADYYRTLKRVKRITKSCK